MRSPTSNILIIQTAFIGDVILATSFIEQVKEMYPNSSLHFLLRKGNEEILKNNPHIDQVWIWDKANKYKSLFSLLKNLRSYFFEEIFLIQRFFTMGLMSVFLKKKKLTGFDKNPFSYFFTQRIKHKIPHYENEEALHEVQRNLLLIGEKESDAKKIRPNIYLELNDGPKGLDTKAEYVVIAPTSVWFTKQWSQQKWKDLVCVLSEQYLVYLIGAKGDKNFCEELVRPNVINLCGKLSLRESASLMKKAKRVIVNDSAPMHLASAVNAPTTAIFCSTIQDFGYFPLADDSIVIEVNDLPCRPCGLHGKKQCPLKHFKCSNDINIKDVLQTIDSRLSLSSS